MLSTADTIAAIATARAGALRGIIRISGPEAIRCLESIFRGDLRTLENPSRPYVVTGEIAASEPIGLVPCDVYVWPNERSYTRQPTCEIHTFGSPPVLDAVLSVACTHGCRLANPGEFTLRAFLAGRIDLTQAEAVLGVIDARNSTELKVALEQLAGGLAKSVSDIRERLIELLARLEAGLDFVEEDIEFISQREITDDLSAIRQSLEAMLAQMDRRSHQLADVRLVLVGWPNVGKSSLFNALSGSTAIVCDEPGTTRDYVTSRIHLQGREATLIDTAGVDSADENTIAAAAQQVTTTQHEQATIRVLCLDSSRPMNPWERSQLESTTSTPTVVVLTKCDLPPRCEMNESAIRTSVYSGIGLTQLRDAIFSELESPIFNDVCIGATAVRCRDSMRRAIEGIATTLRLANVSAGEELIAAELRIVLDELGAIAGTVYTEDILDRIFSRFCIGK